MLPLGSFARQWQSKPSVLLDNIDCCESRSDQMTRFIQCAADIRANIVLRHPKTPGRCAAYWGDPKSTGR